MNLINSVPQAAATTFAFSSVKNLLLCSVDTDLPRCSRPILLSRPLENVLAHSLRHLGKILLTESREDFTIRKICTGF